MSKFPMPTNTDPDGPMEKMIQNASLTPDCRGHGPLESCEAARLPCVFRNAYAQLAPSTKR